jgi:hypothetical protein
MGTGGYGRFSPVGQGFMIEGTATGNVLMKKYYVFVKKVLQIYPNLRKKVTENTKKQKFFYGSNSCS